MGYDIQKEEKFARKLIEVALTGKLITYGELCDAVGLHGYCQALRYYLARIGRKCKECDLPLLPSIVVRKGETQPSDGIYVEFGAIKVTEEQAKVFACKDWSCLEAAY